MFLVGIVYSRHTESQPQSQARAPAEYDMRPAQAPRAGLVLGRYTLSVTLYHTISPPTVYAKLSRLTSTKSLISHC